VVGYEHPIKGQGIYAYVTLMEGQEYSEDLRRELINSVRTIIGAFAAPDVIHWVSQLGQGVTVNLSCSLLYGAPRGWGLGAAGCLGAA
jgi:hypothetical protein